MSAARRYRVVDLFSGGGGMSCGFHRHDLFDIVGAADGQMGKPSSRRGSLGCNETYTANMGIAPVAVDLAEVAPDELFEMWGIDGIDVLLACPPCTGFSRANSSNHIRDDHRNSLVGRVADFARAWRPQAIVLENARELLRGNFSGHFATLREDLEELGYEVSADVHMLTDFGLPQIRERALMIAIAQPLDLRTLDDLWAGYRPDRAATTVRRAIDALPPVGRRAKDADPHHISPTLGESGLARIHAIPADGGSWRDLIGVADQHLTPAMHRSVRAGTLGSHPDVYGRMWWDRPAPTIKRECSHVGNGRYAHPVRDRLCSLREMALLNGFPIDYRFGGTSLSNRYRHVGDAVPPLISYQLAHAVAWSLTGRRPDIGDIVLPGTSLRPADLVPAAVAA
ncbi:DNA cytosine methyltransferase [Millisia brevis]|uniref:DNA cytosine methyltransferase n=1 Tax=Millisia brevis TaxID=264148 RepID=UPI000834C9B0|nr:DNA cytosine methyltransferase [Millisia brevis]